MILKKTDDGKIVRSRIRKKGPDGRLTTLMVVEKVFKGRKIIKERFVRGVRRSQYKGNYYIFAYDNGKLVSKRRWKRSFNLFDAREKFRKDNSLQEDLRIRRPARKSPDSLVKIAPTVKKLGRRGGKFQAYQIVMSFNGRVMVDGEKIDVNITLSSETLYNDSTHERRLKVEHGVEYEFYNAMLYKLTGEYDDDETLDGLKARVLEVVKKDSLIKKEFRTYINKSSCKRRR